MDREGTVERRGEHARSFCLEDRVRDRFDMHISVYPWSNVYVLSVHLFERFANARVAEELGHPRLDKEGPARLSSSALPSLCARACRASRIVKDALGLDQRLAIRTLNLALDPRLAPLLLCQLGADDEVLVRESRLLVLHCQRRSDADVGREIEEGLWAYQGLDTSAATPRNPTTGSAECKESSDAPSSPTPRP